MVLRCRADDGPILVVIGSSLPSSAKKNIVRGTPFLDPCMSEGSGDIAQMG